ncbi:murein L,D-transpeptidase [Plantactinospora sp. S1510]|uniref:Murein L,D-transpeptidase n=1 Tax=Plantactinospora alkalitolerans TaxID=2789879 RepID=A0ABS0GXD7_9ACTN|nr:L,D-transpeptidase family protein [Plantactinospora alkalitolerans]MBF9130741.1 murein L,D-transpeptidase [Plantactinospora alkalitolerans]
MVSARFGTRLVALVAVTLFGAGACAFDPQKDQSGAGGLAPVEAENATGASAPPAPDQGKTPAPTTTKPRPPTTTAPTKKPTRRPVRAGSPKPPSGCPQGDRQRDVERYLARLGGFGTVTVDGRQSAADCAAIKRFQRRYDIRPAEGRAGPTTADVARRLASTDTDKCADGSGTTFCVDLTLQTVWAMRGGKVVMAPTVTRTGMSGFRTPSGTYKVNFRNTKEWSDPYEVWLPYWQRFIGGIGFHQTTTYLHNKSIGSHGCVNLLPTDARRMWDLGKVGTRVHVLGRRPGT